MTNANIIFKNCFKIMAKVCLPWAHSHLLGLLLPFLDKDGERLGSSIEEVKLMCGIITNRRFGVTGIRRKPRQT